MEKKCYIVRSVHGFDCIVTFEKAFTDRDAAVHYLGNRAAICTDADFQLIEVDFDDKSLFEKMGER